MLSSENKLRCYSLAYDLLVVSSITRSKSQSPYYDLQSQHNLASLLFSEQTRHTSASGPLHLLLPLSGIVNPRYLHGSLPHY